jgi:GNAT superfamily N-acetyltransferase
MIIRPMTVYERDTVRGFYLALSDEDRRKRFCCALSDETVVKYVDGLDFAQGTVLAAFDDRARIIGLCELAHGKGMSEMAFAVRADMRGQRIGTRLMERLLARARMCGVHKVFVLFSSENTPMRRLASRAGMQVDTEGGESYASRELESATALDLGPWLVAETAAHSSYFNTLIISGALGALSKAARSLILTASSVPAAR